MRVLIDVDGVLLRQNIYTPQADCIVEAVMEVAGAYAAMEVQTWDWVGRTDLDILRHGVGEGEPLLDARAAYLRLFRERCPESLAEERNEPVWEAISEARFEMGFTIQPVTGNLEPVARMKLQRSDWNTWVELHLGGYGEHGGRPDILRAAMTVEPSAYVYVGDTWRDMAAARLAGVRFVGWETEKHRGELDDADWVARDADELVQALGEAAWCEA